MDGGTWWATLVHGVTKSQTRLSDFTYLLTYLRETERGADQALMGCLSPVLGCCL